MEYKLEDGRWVPTFPNAKYIFARTELEFWKQQSEQDPMTRTGDYIVDSVVPILEAKQEVLVDMDHQLDDGLTFNRCPATPRDGRSEHQFRRGGGDPLR